jgi:hypothetical protein
MLQRKLRTKAVKHTLVAQRIAMNVKLNIWLVKRACGPGLPELRQHLLSECIAQAPHTPDTSRLFGRGEMQCRVEKVM